MSLILCSVNKHFVGFNVFTDHCSATFGCYHNISSSSYIPAQVYCDKTTEARITEFSQDLTRYLNFLHSKFGNEIQMIISCGGSN